VYSWFIKAADNLASFREVISNVSPKLAAIASAHHPVARALVLAAREDGVPSVYVPHAPTIALRHLEDLPVDYVALRGQAEAELFAEHGADPARLTVGGNPSIEADEPPELDADGTPVLALSPFSDEMLGAMLEVAGAALEEAVVAPHPRLQPETLALPDGWTVWPERTYDLLKTGPPVLVQSSSGVALEALHLGVPTINLAFPGAVAYPFIREPEIPQVGTSGELSQAVERARRDAADIAARRELTAWAKRWSDPNGAPALERIGAIFTGAVADGPREAIWDHWSPA
jgi:hypothetical protein